MQAEQLDEVQPIGGISAFWLKIIAITGMVLQHSALALPGTFPLGLEIFLQISGGLTFPIMAFLLVEGFNATRNLHNYMKRLAVFGAISFIPHLFALGSGLNIMFTLLVGLFLLNFRHKYGNSPKFWFAFIGLILVTGLFDWGVVGPIAIVLYDMIKNEKTRRIVVPIFIAVGVIVHGIVFSIVMAPFIDMEALLADTTIAGAFFPLGSLLTIPLLLMYKGERGRAVKWFFYAFYPAHLAVLAIISAVMGNNVFLNFVRQLAYGLEPFL
ncbi:MAG: conjugal transfer protein TraX [Defluviitaleaceae bacterium]|nr:conjugal transfer protein TraX [Defluviitaleaceae bacterium]